MHLSACAKKETTEAPAVVQLPSHRLKQQNPQLLAPATPTPIPTTGPTATLVPTVETSKYKEAPVLADMVKAGKLPPVEERLPKNPARAVPG